MFARLRPGTEPDLIRTPSLDGQAELVSNDAAKAFIPVLALRMVFPDEPYALLCGVAVLVGHLWPVWHGFRGGGGNSSIMGMLLAIDPLALLVTHGAGVLAGRVVPIIAFVAGVALTIPWFAWRNGIGSAEMWFAVAITVLYIAPQVRAASEIRRLKREGHELDIAHVMGMMRTAARTGKAAEAPENDPHIPPR